MHWYAVHRRFNVLLCIITSLNIPVQFRVSVVILSMDTANCHSSMKISRLDTSDKLLQSRSPISILTIYLSPNCVIPSYFKNIQVLRKKGCKAASALHKMDSAYIMHNAISPPPACLCFQAQHRILAIFRVRPIIVKQA